jgi:uncharacterized protein
MLKWIDDLLRPDEYYYNLLMLDFGHYYSQGYRLVILDIDNTLGVHGSRTADQFAREARDRIQAAGLVCWLVSNGSGGRISSFAASLGLPCVAMAYKPFAYGLRRACKLSGIPPNQAIFVGDQVMTDIIAAHRAGCRAILVRPLASRESWNVKIKRLLENIILQHYHLK